MGCGLWSDSSFRSYSSSRGRDVDSDTGILKVIYLYKKCILNINYLAN